MEWETQGGGRIEGKNKPIDTETAGGCNGEPVEAFRCLSQQSDSAALPPLLLFSPSSLATEGSTVRNIDGGRVQEVQEADLVHRCVGSTRRRRTCFVFNLSLSSTAKSQNVGKYEASLTLQLEQFF